MTTNGDIPIVSSIYCYIGSPFLERNFDDKNYV